MWRYSTRLVCIWSLKTHKLLLRLYDPTEGEILLNGKNIKEYSRRTYWDLFAPVYQNVKVLAFTVAENIALCERESIDEEKLMNTLDQVGLIEKIMSLKNGLSTFLFRFLDDEGIEVSGEGEKIRKSRALYTGRKAYILDEPAALWIR